MSSTVDDLADLLMMFPWWLNCLLAGITYALLTYWVPTLEPKPLLVGLFRAGPTLAPYISGLFVLAAVLTGVRSYRRRKLFDSRQTIESIRTLSWKQFESFIAEGFRRKGYVIQEADTGPDGGVDVRVSKNGKTYYVQCKQWREQSIGVKPVRELAGVVAAKGVAGGVLITSGRFTSDAREFADDSGLVELIDGEDLLGRFGSVEEGDIPESGAEVPACPKCGGTMHRRVARRGERAGKPFWGCGNYPACRGLINIEDAKGAAP